MFIQIQGKPMSGAEWMRLYDTSKQITFRDYTMIVSELASLKFDSIGSLYFSKPTPLEAVMGPISWGKFSTSYRETLPIYDRGPWKTSNQWLKASLTDNLQLMSANPKLAQSLPSSVFEENSWNSALTVLPEALRILPDVLQENSDIVPDMPFVLTHIDLGPWYAVFSVSQRRKWFCSQSLNTIHHIQEHISRDLWSQGRQDRSRD